MANDTFYLTTTLPYVNAAPHIGFALEIVAADIIARYQRLLGKKVIFNTGTDEHGQKIYQQALKNKQDPQAYVDEYAAKFDELKQLLNLSYTNFIRTTNPAHQAAAQEFWRRCLANGYIYKSKYKTKYCVGCEMEKTESELEQNKCPLHPTKELEIRTEENYFFKFSEFQKLLLALYQNNQKFVQPQSKLHEITSFVEQGLQDFSISRVKEKMPWGITVPDDPEQVMYVWFDALVNYISTLGWPSEKGDYQDFWPGVQLCGKDNLRQQAAMWQAMLMAADLPNSTKILINGFISIDGQKMSKSSGNVISPSELVGRYGVDGARYLLTNLGVFNGDIDVTWKRFDETYTADLTNGLGNLCSRVAKMCEKTHLTGGEFSQLKQSFINSMDDYSLTQTLSWITAQITATDQYLSATKPWKKTGVEQAEILKKAVRQIIEIAVHLQPFMPTTAKKIINHFSQLKIVAIEPLFPRLS